MQHAKVHNPQFSLDKRTVASVRRLTMEWHREMGRMSVVAHLAETWQGSSRKDFTHKTENGEIWEIRQIKTRTLLVEEGSTMHHCVASYGCGCVMGEHSIWSLVRIEANKPVRKITIQLSSTGVIVQAKGLYNRNSSPEEREIMQRWCETAGLRLQC